MTERPPGGLHAGFVLSSLAGGGAERVTLELAGLLIGRGHRVDLLLLRCAGPYRDAVPRGLRLYRPWGRADRGLLRRCRARGVETRALPIGPLAAVRAWRALRRGAPGIRVRAGNVRDALGVARYLREARPRVLLSALPRANAAAILGAGLSGAPAPPVAVAVHTNVAEAYDAAQQARARLLYPRADAVVAVSRGAAGEVVRTLGVPAGRVRVVHNPVPEPPPPDGGPPPHPWFRGGAPPVVLTVGGESPAKDYGTLLEAFALARRDLGARLVVVGDLSARSRADLRAQARRLGVERDLAVLGFDERLDRYLRRAALFVLSSRFEALPSSLLEALACGTPVVSSDAPYGPSEILEGGRWGALVPVGDAPALARAVAAALGGDRPPADALRRRAADFSGDRAAGAYEALLAELADARPS